MIKTDPHHKKFQLDRIALFSDAVFAIAITLLIIEIKIPDIEAPFTDAHLGHELLYHWTAKFIGLFVSFLVIGRFWVFHHRLFGYVVDYNPKLIWTNMLFLLTVIIMPFSTGFFSDYWQSGLMIPLLFYVCNICFTGIMNYRLLAVVSHKPYHLSQGLTPGLVAFFKMRSLIAPLIFLIAIPVAFMSIMVAYFIPLLIPVVSILVNRYYRKKHPEFFN